MQNPTTIETLSYAPDLGTPVARMLVRTVETLTGRPHLMCRARLAEADTAYGEDIWSALVRRCGLSFDVVRGSLENIPREGPLILVANHPFGVLDGLVMGYLLSAIRGDFRIVANSVFRQHRLIDDVILPVDFSRTPEAVTTNLATRKTAQDYLSQGGAIGIFPGGTVSTADRFGATARDPQWRNFSARLIAKSEATVVPVYFAGQNSALFQLASRLSYPLRLALLLREFRLRLDRPVEIAVGQPFHPAQIPSMAGDPARLMDWMRARTYALSPEPVRSLDYGYEFDPAYRQIA